MYIAANPLNIKIFQPVRIVSRDDDSQHFGINRDYFVGDYVTVEHRRFGMIQPKMQLVGMIEALTRTGTV